MVHAPVAPHTSHRFSVYPVRCSPHGGVGPPRQRNLTPIFAFAGGLPLTRLPAISPYTRQGSHHAPRTHVHTHTALHFWFSKLFPSFARGKYTGVCISCGHGTRGWGTLLTQGLLRTIPMKTKTPVNYPYTLTPLSASPHMCTSVYAQFLPVC